MASWRPSYDQRTADDQPVGYDTRSDRRRDEWPAFHAQPNAHVDFHRHAPHPVFSMPSSDPAAVYPVAPLQTSSAGTHAGRFIHTQCDQELFHAEYLRSNKASGHKNLRCFPHCCGGHNPKSFCGSGLLVECALPHAQFALGRFEEVVKSPLPSKQLPEGLAQPANGPGPELPTATTSFLDHSESDDGQPPADPVTTTPSDQRIAVGREYARHELFRELKSSENPFGMWFKGVAVLSATDAPRFHLNGNRASWHYGWQSSRLNCKNLHVFKVYFFQHAGGDPAAPSLQCVASVSSPPFRISSSRKARKTFKSSPSRQSLGDAVSDDQLSIPQSSPRAEDDRMSIDSFDGDAALPRAVATARPHAVSRSRSSFDLGINMAYAMETPGNTYNLVSPSFARGDMLPSLSSRLARGHTTGSSGDPFGARTRHYRGQPDRKRLTRSASLQTDYYSSPAPFSFATAHVPTTPTREPRARTNLGDETPPRVSRSDMMSMDSLLNSTSPQREYPQEPEFRPALPAISVPLLTLSYSHQQQQQQQQQPHHHHHHTATTPVADMMQLRLETPRVLARASSVSSISSVLSSSMASTFDTQRSRASTTTSRPRRKRNRSLDSGKGSDNPSASKEWFEGPLLEEIAPSGDWDLVAQAHALSLVVAVATRLQRVDDATNAGGSPAGASPATYKVVWQPARAPPSVVRISPATKPALATMCDVLLAVASQLIHHSSFLLDVRAKMRELVGQCPPERDESRSVGPCKNVAHCGESLFAFVVPRVEAELAKVMTTSNQENSASPSLLAELIRSAEHELVDEPWWRDVSLFDDDDDEFPCMDLFKGFFEAVRASAAHEELAIPSGVADAVAPLTGEWRLVQASTDKVAVSAPSSVAAFAPTSWLQHQVKMFLAQSCRIIETAASVTVTLPNSLVASASPFTAVLDHHEPLLAVPTDHFPFAATRQNLLLAYRAWRDSTSTVVLQYMAWPRESDCPLVATDASSSTKTTQSEPQQHDPDGAITAPSKASRRRLLRTRVTVFVSAVSSAQLHVRLVVEGSVTQDAALCALALAPANATDMVAYFMTPASWETLTQATLQYERV